MASGRIDGERARVCAGLIVVLFAEFERSIIQKHIARAPAKGTRSGKAFGWPKLSAEREAAVRAAMAAGVGIRKTARHGQCHGGAARG